MAKTWKYMDLAERSRRENLGKAQWRAMSKEDKEEFRKLALNAVRETSKEGSKLEKFLCEALSAAGHGVSFHSEHILPGTRLQTDLHIPSLRTVIEIDGPTHFFPIWGEESLDRNIASDNKKNQQLLTYGFVVIRIKHISKNLSEKYKRDLLNTILNLLDDIKKEFPALENRLIEIEV
jgi:very-short-patch-repair endonuclease